MQKHLRSAALLGLLVTVISLQSCSAWCKKKTQAVETETATQKHTKMDLKQPVSTIDLRILESETLTVIPNDFSSILKLLEKAQYDKKWNETAIMVKMKTPDYSMDLKSDGQEPQLVYFWVEGSRLKVDDTWFLLKPADSKNLAEFLSKYKNTFNK